MSILRYLMCLLVVLALTDPVCGELVGVDVVWTNPSNVTINGNTITKNDYMSVWNAGAASVQVIPAGTDGGVEVTVTQTNAHRMFGLSDSDNGPSYNTIDYAIYLCNRDGLVSVYENGVDIGGGGSLEHYAYGDVFRVERTGTVVKYLRNGMTFYTSIVPSSTVLLVDAAILTPGGEIANAVIFLEESVPVESHSWGIIKTLYMD